MTPQEALAQALIKAIDYQDKYADEAAADILDALREEWALVGLNTYHDSAFQVGIRFGAQQERERLRAIVDKVNDDDIMAYRGVAYEWVYDVLLADPEPDR